MSTDPMQITKGAQGLHGAIGKALDPHGGILRCEECGRVKPMEKGDASRYTANGWPRCCGYTMRWWTQRQIDAGEVPPITEERANG